MIAFEYILIISHIPSTFYNSSAFLDLSLRIFTTHIHDAGYVKEKNKKGRNKEDRSYISMRHDFILRNLYYDFVDIFRSFGLKPYLSPSVNDSCPQLADLLRIWCYKTDCDKDDIKTVMPVFRLLAKSCGKAVDIVHAPRVLYRRDFRVSPLLPAMWAISTTLRIILTKSSSPWNVSMFSRLEK